MTNPITTQTDLRGLSPTNGVVIIGEIAVVFLPFIVGLIASDAWGSTRIAIGRDLVILGGPLSYLGLTISLVLLWVVSRRRRVGWRHYGLRRPQSWVPVALQSLGIALLIFLVVRFIINPVITALPNAGVQDLSRFDYLEGSLPNLVIMLVNIWITAAFLEEFLFRGYLLNRLFDLSGKQTGAAWAIALFGQAIIFGLVHAYQSPIGMLKVGLIGLVFGLSYLVVGRKLWPLILAHGLIDSLDMVAHYFGG